MENSILFINAHIVVDGNKEIISGAMAFKDTIEDIYYHINDKLLRQYEGRIYDLKGLILMPSFVNIYKTEYKGLYDNGIDISYNNRILIHRCINEEDIDDKYLIAPIKNNLSKYDVILDLSNIDENFDFKNPTLINRAFNNESFVNINIDNIHDDVLDYLFKTINRNKLIITSDKSHSEVIDRLLKHHIDRLDMALYLNLNLLKLLKYQRSGELIRGKDATFDIYDEDMNYLYHVDRGEYDEKF